MTILRRIWRGATYCECQGHHPGKGLLLFLIGMGGFAGLHSGSLLHVLFGMGVMAGIFGSLFLWGCYEAAGSCTCWVPTKEGEREK